MTDVGVVDPIRIPSWVREPSERLWRGLPPLGRWFVVLALVDIVARAVGVVEPRMYSGDNLLLDVGDVVPHDLWILLPTLVLARRPDAATATRSIIVGAVVLALAELLAGPLFQIVNQGFPDGIAVGNLMALLRPAVQFVGWLLLARGLAELNPRKPSRSIAALSNIVALSVAGAIAAGLYGLAIQPPFDFGDAVATAVSTLTSWIGAFLFLGWGYLLWVIVRGLGDTRRPRVAVVTAAVGACLSGVLGLLVAIPGAVAMTRQQTFDVLFGTGGQDLVNVLVWTQIVVGSGLILVAFGLGLGEPPIPDRPSAASDIH